MDRITATVIVTSYNHAKYVKRALDSIIKQKVDFCYEIIIHDDASTDNTRSIIETFIAEHSDILIKPIFQSKNLHSRGLRIFWDHIRPEISGKYMITCEGDDFWIDENKLRTQVDFLEANPQYIGIGHNCLFVGEDDQPLNYLPYECYGPYCEHVFKLSRLAFGAYPGQTATLLYRSTDYLDAIRKHKEEFYAIRANGDKKRNLELLLNGDIYYLDKEMSAYRVVLTSGSSWSASKYNSNRLFESFVDSEDSRKYAKRIYQRRFSNEFQTFYVATQAIIIRIRKPTEENKYVLSQIVHEKGGLARFFLYYIFLGIDSLPRYLWHKATYKRYQKK